MNGKGDRLMKRPPDHLALLDSLYVVISPLVCCFMLMMMMTSRFYIVCFFFITLPAYFILCSLKTVSTMVELCNNRSVSQISFKGLKVCEPKFGSLNSQRLNLHSLIYLHRETLYPGQQVACLIGSDRLNSLLNPEWKDNCKRQ